MTKIVSTRIAKDIKQTTCLQCGKRFNVWRAKQYCSEPCRKKAQNVRLGYVRRDDDPTLPDTGNTEDLAKQNQRLANPFRRDEGFEWVACSEVTRKLTRKGSPAAIGWVMLIAGQGWFGRIGKDFSFGPATTPTRAMKAVEAKLTGQWFEKLDGENSWTGDCMHLLVGRKHDKLAAGV